jgi:hypothetical protein
MIFVFVARHVVEDDDAEIGDPGDRFSDMLELPRPGSRTLF